MAKPTQSEQKRIKELRKLIAHHNKRYHEDDAPEISDEAYDSLVRELRGLQGIHASSDPTLEAVGGTPSEAFTKVRHDVRQYSFGNVFTPDELREWNERTHRFLLSQDIRETCSYVAEHKIDGLKVILTYTKGKLIRAATRGDGITGEDVTHTVTTIQDVPHTLTQPVDLIAVGEVWLSEKEFQRINVERKQNDEPLFANPRNAAAGSLRQLDASVTQKRNLATFVYDIDYIDVRDTKLSEPKNQWEELMLLKKLGFHTNEENALCENIGEVIAYYDTWKQKHEKLPYGVDGVVVKVNDIVLQRALGHTAKAPRFGIAFKFPSVEATTVIENIDLQVGRTGVVTPVAHLRPVFIDGSTVSRATLHNEDQIKRLDIRVGDTVILHKAGDVIPEIVSILPELRPKNSKPYTFPKKVIGCGGDGSIERIPGEAAYRCKVTESEELHRQRLHYFVSKAGLNIDGVGPKIIDLLLANDLISEYYDLFTLTVGDLKDLPGFQEKAAENVVAAIQKARNVPLHRLLVALSIDHVGEETARLIARRFGTLKELQTAELDEIASIHGVGETVAHSLNAWMRNSQNVERLSKLLPHLRIEERKEHQKTTALTNKTIVFTGTLESLTRDEAKQRAREAGAHVAASVSGKTDFVVVGSDAGSKEEKAKKLGVTILSEEEFKKMA